MNIFRISRHLHASLLTSPSDRDRYRVEVVLKRGEFELMHAATMTSAACGAVGCRSRLTHRSQIGFRPKWAWYGMHRRPPSFNQVHRRSATSTVNQRFPTTLNKFSCQLLSTLSLNPLIAATVFTFTAQLLDYTTAIRLDYLD